MSRESVGVSAVRSADGTVAGLADQPDFEAVHVNATPIYAANFAMTSE